MIIKCINKTIFELLNVVDSYELIDKKNKNLESVDKMVLQYENIKTKIIEDKELTKEEYYIIILIVQMRKRVFENELYALNKAAKEIDSILSDIQSEFVD